MKIETISKLLNNKGKQNNLFATEKEKKEKAKPSVERMKTPNEEKYNKFVANLYRKGKKSKK